MYVLYRGVEPSEYRLVFPSDASRNFHVTVCPRSTEIGAHCGMLILLMESGDHRRHECTFRKQYIGLAANMLGLCTSLNIEWCAFG